MNSIALSVKWANRPDSPACTNAYDEYVVIEDVFNGIEMGREMINTLGYKLYHKPKGRPKYHGHLWD